MITMNGTVTFYLKDIFPFTVRYEATVQNGEVVDIIEDVEESSVDILKHNLEWAYNDALYQAVQIDVNQRTVYINS